MPDAESRTVFVLGAGFTKAFLPNAPLLVDDYDGAALLQEFAHFPYAAGLIELEMSQPDHSSGWINLERLMTRLIGEMPHDHRTGSEHVFALIVQRLKRSFLRRLSDAKSQGVQNEGELRLFAGHCITTKSTCITFNYDDALDEALWTYQPAHVRYGVWSPDWGYGFPCRMSQACVMDVPAAIGDPGVMLLLKMHGSVNWRIPLGYPKPYVMDAVRHHEEWFQHYGAAHPKVEIQTLAPFLETDPLIIPPILSKSELNEQPVLRLTWSNAIEALERATQVVFLGYSLPITDIAAGFLFREGLRHIAGDAVSVVDFADSEESRERKLEQLIRPYRSVTPGINADQFNFRGAVKWVRDHLTRWLYDSKGCPIAFEALGFFVSNTGEFIGSRCRKTEIWRRGYRGDVVDGNRWLFRHSPPTDDPGGNQEPPPLPRPGHPPDRIEPMSLPTGFRDVEPADLL